MIVTSALMCLALNIYHESRGEVYMGQALVAQVTLNRVEANNSTICEEVTAEKQFSWTNNNMVKKLSFGWKLDEKLRPKDKKAWMLAKVVAEKALFGEFSETFGKATHFHTIYVRPKWAASFHRIGRFGKHIAYSSV